jgi:biotin synthase
VFHVEPPAPRRSQLSTLRAPQVDNACPPRRLLTSRLGRRSPLQRLRDFFRGGIDAGFSPLPRDLALDVLRADGPDLFDLLAGANRVRHTLKGDTIRLCGIANAKSGRCAEDCSFCSQSSRYATAAPSYPMRAPDDLVAAACAARDHGAVEFSLVTSGERVQSAREVGALAAAIAGVRAAGLESCASLGAMRREQLQQLRAAGLTRLHHNLETARSFFPRLCTTHTYDERVATVRLAQELGFYTCCGGIFGVGESLEQRVELCYELQELGPDAIPLNFLDPRPGTPLAGATNLTPRDCLRIIALFRLAHPRRDLFVCGGREVNLRQLQALVFAAGANGMMVGGYLTTPGRPAGEDHQLVRDLGLELEGLAQCATA